MSEEKKEGEVQGMQYPYIASLKRPMLIHRAIALDIIKPTEANSRQR